MLEHAGYCSLALMTRYLTIESLSWRQIKRNENDCILLMNEIAKDQHDVTLTMINVQQKVLITYL